MKKRIVFLALVVLALCLVPATAAHADVHQTTKALPSVCTHRGYTLVRFRVVGEPVHFNWEASVDGDNYHALKSGGIYSPDNYKIKIRIPRDTEIRINVWSGNSKHGPVLLDYSSRSLLC